MSNISQLLMMWYFRNIKKVLHQQWFYHWSRFNDHFVVKEPYSTHSIKIKMCDFVELGTAMTNSIFTSVCKLQSTTFMWYMQLLWRSPLRRSKLDINFWILVRIICTLPSESKQSKNMAFSYRTGQQISVSNSLFVWSQLGRGFVFSLATTRSS